MNQQNLPQLSSAVRTIQYELGDYLTENEKYAVTNAEKRAESIVANALSQVDGIVTNAETESLRILQEAQQKAEEIQAKAQEEGQTLGYDTGYQAGYKQAIDDAVGIIKAAEIVLKGSYKAQKEIIISTEKEILVLAAMIAKNIVKNELKLNPSLMLNLVKTATQELKDRENIKIFINPVNVQLLLDVEETLKKTIIGLENIKIVEDKSIKRDGVVVESPSGRIDASVETQINEILDTMLEHSINDPYNIYIPDDRPVTQDDLQHILNHPTDDV